MLSLLTEFEDGIFSDWRASVLATIKRYMNNYLLARNSKNTKFLELNFSPKVRCVYKNFILFYRN